MTLSTGQIIQHRYRVVRLLGQGGFGTVYRAWDIQMQGPCALKRNLVTSTEAGDQFSREARMLFSLRHPSLPRVIDYFIESDLGEFLVMEYIEGQDLKSMIVEKNAPLAEEVVVDWICQVCDALSYLHKQSPPIIHRDIKPGNIKVTPSVTRPNGLAVLVDFGIAKAFDPESKTAQGARAVTPGFSPLEQYGLGVTDHQSDIYALGATAYYLLTGEQPSSSLGISLGSAAPLAPANQVNSHVSPAVSDAIEAATQIDRRGRTNSAAEFKDGLLSGGAIKQPHRAASQPGKIQAHPKQAVPRPAPAFQKPPLSSQHPKAAPGPSDSPVEKPAPPAPISKPANKSQPLKNSRSPSAGLPKWFPCLLGAALLGILITLIGIVVIGLFYR